IEVDLRRRFQSLQRLDRRAQLHAVIGGELLAALQLLAMRFGFEDGAPAARAWIARTGAIGMDHHFRPLRHVTPRVHNRDRTSPADGSGACADIRWGPSS